MQAAPIVQPVVPRAPWPVALGLMLTALTVLVSQIALTRIMSVTVNYHSAFLILSVVMLGMAASAIAAYLGMRRLERPVTIADSVGAAYKSGLATLIAVICFVAVVARDWGPYSQPIQLIVAAIVFFSWFFYSGYVVAVVLSHYAADMSRLYWYDLVGAALGCLLVVPLLNQYPALNVILLCAAGMAIAGTLLAQAHGSVRAQRLGMLLALLLTAVWVVSAVWPELLRLQFAKGQDQSQVRWERWNALARVTVTTEIPGISSSIEHYQRRHGAPLSPEEIEKLRRLWQAGWGTSRNYDGPVLPAMWLQLDTDAGTPILQDGVAALANKGQLNFLAWDVTAAAYAWRGALKPSAGHVFIVGGGGGRDVLTALSHGAEHVDVVELNPAVVEAATVAFGDYSGRVYKHPKVNLTVGEARSELSRRDHRYDLIQMSMIDTWASSMAGAMVMTENSLYTQEAFDLYLDRLKPDGMLSVSRWFDPVRYGEAARVVVLMASTLKRAGVERPEDHIAMLVSPGYLDMAVTTLVCKRSPLTVLERTALQRLARERGYRLFWPQSAEASDAAAVPFDIAGLLRLEPPALADRRFDLSPPTDDRPFFFNIDRPIASWIDAVQSGEYLRGSRATLVLGVTLLVMGYACVRFVIRPMRASLAADGAAPRPSFLSPLLYFGGIGAGFMLIEIALIQRYILFLGHPSYAISVVLFALLLFGGLGSWLTEGLETARLRRATPLALAPILAGTIVSALFVPSWLENMSAWSWPARLGASLALISPLALFMGMICPMGVRRLAATGRQDLVPWMWGINGICGVIASVLGMILAMNFSYTVVLACGAAAYGVTFLSLWLPEKSSQPFTATP